MNLKQLDALNSNQSPERDFQIISENNFHIQNYRNNL